MRQHSIKRPERADMQRERRTRDSKLIRLIPIGIIFNFKALSVPFEFALLPINLSPHAVWWYIPDCTPSVSLHVLSMSSVDAWKWMTGDCKLLQPFPQCIQLKSRTLFVRDSAAGEVTVRSCVTHNALLSSSHHHHLCCIIICNRIRVWRTKRRSEKENCDFVQEYNMRAGRYKQPSWPNGQNYDATADDNDE